MWLARAAIVQALFAASILGVAAVAHSSWEAATASAVLAYGLVYVYGLGACTSFVAGLRAVAEHQIGPDGAPVVGRAALRNLRCNPITRLVFGAYGFADHATHRCGQDAQSFFARSQADARPRRVGPIAAVRTGTVLSRRPGGVALACR